MKQLLAILLSLFAAQAFAASATISSNTGATYSGLTMQMIREGNPTTNYDGTSPSEVTSWGAGDNNWSLIKPSGLSNISGPVTVSSATLRLYLEGSTTSDATYEIAMFELLRNFTPSQATWNVYTTGNSWGTAGATGAADSESSSSATLVIGNDATGAYYEWTSAQLATDVENQINSGNYYGWLLRKVSTLENSSAREFTTQTGSDGARPELVITYTAAATATRVQEGFRFGVDDGSESAHTWEAAQDTNISTAANTSRLIRALVDTTDDAASVAYTLRYQKNGTGGYVAVPVGSTTASSISNQTVAASADDAAEATGGTVTLTGTTIGASLDATTEWVGMRFTNITIPPGATITAATLGVVPSATTEDEPLVTVYMEAADNCATFTTTASSISGRSRTTGVSWSSTDLTASGSSYHDAPSLVSDVQAVVDRGGWASGNALCVLIQGGATGTRDLTVEAYDLGPGTNPPRLSISWTVPNDVYVSTSANITAGGEATTARLTAPSGKTSGDFTTGRRWDDENGTDSIDIATDFYTEVEWALTLRSGLSGGTYFDFRVYAGASALDTYDVTPRWTVAGGGSSPVPVILNLRKQMSMNEPAANDSDYTIPALFAGISGATP